MSFCNVEKWVLNFGEVSFNSPNAITTNTLEDLCTIMGDNMHKVVGLSHIHSWRLVDWRCCIGHFRTREVHLIMLMWVYFWPRWRVYLAFGWSKHFLTFQVRYSNENTRTWGVFGNCNLKIWTGNPYWLAFCDCNSFFFRPILDAQLYNKT
jgi:hypothetical protein